MPFDSAQLVYWKDRILILAAALHASACSLPASCWQQLYRAVSNVALACEGFFLDLFKSVEVMEQKMGKSDLILIWCCIHSSPFQGSKQIFPKGSIHGCPAQPALVSSHAPHRV